MRVKNDVFMLGARDMIRRRGSPRWRNNRIRRQRAGNNGAGGHDLAMASGEATNPRLTNLLRSQV